MSEKYIARNSPIDTTTPTGDVIVFSTLDSTFFILNETGAVIWYAADGMTPLSEIVLREICGRFKIGARAAGRDAERFVEALSIHGVLLVSDTPIDPSPLAAAMTAFECK